LIDSSTIDPITSKGIAEKLKGKGIGKIDAPVSGGVKVRLDKERRTEGWSKATAAASICITIRSSLILQSTLTDNLCSSLRFSQGAEAGTLTFMVGGEDSDLDAARNYLEVMGANIVHCGANGAGQSTKLCNNLAMGIQMIGVVEALNMGTKVRRAEREGLGWGVVLRTKLDEYRNYRKPPNSPLCNPNPPTSSASTPKLLLPS